MDPLSERVILAHHETKTGQVQLQQRTFPTGETAYEIIVDGVFLMASYNRTSGGALTRYALDALPIRPDSEARVLVGGLGMGFTLQEALVDGVIAVDVAELSSYIVEWNRTYFGDMNGHALDDPRTRLLQGDLYSVLEMTEAGAYHIIALDVDNGPSWLAHEDNARLYTLDSLQRWTHLLVPGGIFGVWSAQQEPAFLAIMKQVYAYVDELPVTAQDHRPEIPNDYIYLGREPLA